MLGRRLPLCLVAMLAIARGQDAVDRDAYARDYVRFLVLQLDQWSKEFPRRFDLAVVKPPVDAARLSPAAKASAGELGDSIRRLASLAGAADILTNSEFRTQVDKSLAAAKELNLAMAGQRFPASLESDWDQLRSTLNNLARAYKLETLAFLEPPAAAPRQAATGGGVRGYFVDLKCAKQGKAMWTNANCVASCLRDGEKAVFVTEEGKVYQIANPDKITPETYGKLVTLAGKTVAEIITIDSVTL